MTNGPYIGLDYFLEQDADVFFGRSAERTRIIGNLQTSRLTLLHAESGVGKSSLLRAGVAARLRQLAVRSLADRGSARYVPVVYTRWRGDPTDGLIEALESAVQPLHEAKLMLRRDALEHAIEDVARSVDTTALFILDQFEERFLYESDDGFDDELARCITRRDLRAHFLISVREDAYSLIGDRFKPRIPNVYGNYLSLDFLGGNAAREAIVGPIAVFNQRFASGRPEFEIEDRLVDAVLEQVRRGRVAIGDRGSPEVRLSGQGSVETAYLQLVMRRLWEEEVSAGSSCLRLETLRTLGGADTIVRAHLDDVMAKLPDEERDAAAAAFRFLVTSGGRKIALSSQELREFSGAPAAPLQAALKHLEQERILRSVPWAETAGDGAHREIFHDVLAPAILDWRLRHVEEQRRAATERRLAHSRERARRLEIRNRRLTAAVVALASVTVALALYLWDPRPLRRLELGTIDARFSVRGSRTPDPRVVLVSVDDQTLKRRDAGRRGQLERGDYASILERVYRDRPAVIALDVIFNGRRDPVGDQALLDAFRVTHDRLVIPFDLFEVMETKDRTAYLQPQLLGRPETVRGTGVRTGFAGLPDDDDGHIRRADYQVDTTAELSWPTFAFAAADVATGGRVRRPVAARRASGDQSEQTTWIDFAGQPGAVRPVSAVDVLDGRTAQGTFAGKLVVIGLVSRGSQDVHRTPFDGGGRGMAGPEIQATALETMIQGAPLRDVSLLMNFLAILLLAGTAAAASLSRSRAIGAAAIAGSACVFLVAVQVAFGAGWIFTVIVPLVALAVGTTVIVLLLLARALRNRSSEASAPGTPRT